MRKKGELSLSTALRCRARYFTGGVILGSAEYVEQFVEIYRTERGRKYPPKVNRMQGADWGGLAVIKGMRNAVFG